ncbi:MAG: TM1266 family iron-only hydrogenase system putative regulator [Bacillota bacterium]|jgi:putative iron-only hydrogenase system regulator
MNAKDISGTRRIGVVGIVVTSPRTSASRVQEVLTAFSDLIVGRMGIPYRDRGVSVIALIVDGDTDHVGALTGRLGSLPGVIVRSALTTFGQSGTLEVDKDEGRRDR